MQCILPGQSKVVEFVLEKQIKIDVTGVGQRLKFPNRKFFILQHHLSVALAPVDARLQLDLA